MAYPDSFLRLVVQCSLYGGAEDATFSLSLISDFPSPEAPETVPAGVVTATTALIQSAGNFSSRLRLENIKLNEIGQDGRYVAETTVEADVSGSGITGVVSAFPPPQVALCVTLRTAAARGLAHSGRFYLPLPARSLATDGRLSTGDRDAYITAATTYLNALNTALPGWRVGVTSPVRTGQERFVTRVAVGRVLDTMRSRRRSLIEDYAEGAALA